jgi:hypothetical protein
MNLSDEQIEEFLKNKIRRDDFAAQVNTEFRVNENFNAELIEVSELKSYPRQESFSLLFLLPEQFPIQQGNYVFEHPQLGTHEIFVAPVEQTSDGIIFEAVFNRLRSKS